MGKSLQSAARLQELSRFVSSPKPHSHNRPKQTQPRSATVKVEPPKNNNNNESFVVGDECRTPLARVVADCAKRWFQDTLKEAKAGDSAMQVLIGQMYNSGYGVPRDPRKFIDLGDSAIVGLLRLVQLAIKSQDPQATAVGHAWISKASRSRNSVWKVSEKQPGYRASDSDSCEPENKAKSYP